MEALTERQKLLLTLIIHEFAKDAAPVGSKSLVDQFNLDLSTATVRNDMSALTDMGYLRQPHTSAGRVPTESGYRFFVGNLLQHTDLPDATRHMISHQFYQMRHDVDQWMRLAVSVLASQSQSASLITAPHAEKPVFKHVELISTRGPAGINGAGIDGRRCAPALADPERAPDTGATLADSRAGYPTYGRQ